MRRAGNNVLHGAFSLRDGCGRLRSANRLHSVTTATAQRVCRECGTTVPSSARCHVCRAAWKTANREHVSARTKAYRKANAERIRVRSKAWCDANAESQKAKAAAWRLIPANLEREKENNRKWREANPEKVRAAARARRARIAVPKVAPQSTEQRLANRRVSTNKRRYGLAAEQHADMIVAQGGMCAICRATPSIGKVLHVDHNHATKRVRALLCSRCNFLVGAYESPLATAAQAYLRRHA
jgi:hypothetical protein